MAKNKNKKNSNHPENTELTENTSSVEFSLTAEIFKLDDVSVDAAVFFTRRR